MKTSVQSLPNPYYSSYSGWLKFTVFCKVALSVIICTGVFLAILNPNSNFSKENITSFYCSCFSFNQVKSFFCSQVKKEGSHEPSNNSCERANEQINFINAELSQYLKPLLRTLFYRHVKINLNRPCLFWKNNPLCLQNVCGVNQQYTHKHSHPNSSRGTSSSVLEVNKNSLGNIKFPSLNEEKILSSAYEDNSVDFTILDNESTSEGFLVNLLDNPERYTGYSGRSPHQIWKALYLENCFNYEKKTNSKYFFYDKSSKEDRHVFEEPWDGCPERSLFYKLISGFHTSVSLHIAYKYLNQSNGFFYPNIDCYNERVGNNPNRIQNLYFSFMVLLRALQKLGPYLSIYPYDTGDVYENQKARDIAQKISSITIGCPNLFNERSLFQGEASVALKQQFRYHFRNISRIMDCVGCEKCRLWGKLQTMGIGTALKILFSFDEDQNAQESITFNYKLTKIEIVALLNTVGKYSESIFYIAFFERLNLRNLNIKLFTKRMYYKNKKTWITWISLVFTFFAAFAFFIWKRKKQKIDFSSAKKNPCKYFQFLIPLENNKILSKQQLNSLY